MNIKTPPKIATVNPGNNEIDVATTLAEIVVGFTTDIDVESLKENVLLQVKDGAAVPFTLTYEFRFARIRPQKKLAPNTTYQLTLRGDNNLDDAKVEGIRSVVGTPMAGVAVLTFTTVKSNYVKPPMKAFPSNETISQTTPVFTWDSETGAVRYEIEVSRNKNLEPLYWSNRAVLTNEATPDTPFEDGIYHWRLRSIDRDENVSDWSESFIFNVDTIKEFPIVDEDTLEPSFDYDRLVEEEYLEVVGTFPKEEATNVSTKLQTIYFKVLGELPDDAKIGVELLGESVLGEDEDHGEVDGEWELIREDGITIIAFTPHALLQNE